MSQQSERPITKKKKKAMPLRAMLVSLGIHIVLIGLATSLTVIVLTRKEEVMFEAKKPPTLTPRKLEHSIRVKQMQKQVRKPKIRQRLVSPNKNSAIALPEMPPMNSPEIKSVKQTLKQRNRAGSALGGIGALGGGAGKGLSGSMGYSETSFFGTSVRTRSIAILLDISPSMVNKGALEDARKEAVEMMSRLHPGTQFNVMVFVDGVKAMEPEMMFATKANRDKAIAWLASNFNPSRDGNQKGRSGSTPFFALEKAVEMGAETVFILTDDVPHIRGNKEHPEEMMDYARKMDTEQGREIRINTVCYKPWNNKRGEASRDYLRKLAKVTGGKYTFIKRVD